MLIITGTGRSGTATLAKMFGGHHEFRVNYILDKYFLRTEPHSDPFDTFEKRTGPMLDLHQGIDPKTFVDSSNLYIHFIDVIFMLYPPVKFILCVRNGKDFVRSAFSRRWHENISFGNVPLRDDPYFGMWNKMTPVQKNAWLWTYRNKKAIEGLHCIPEDQKLIIRIEDIQRDNTLDTLEKFTGIKCKGSVHAERRYNANPAFALPPKEDWTVEMNSGFSEIAGEMMKLFNYE
jgi:hypothetical protein